MSLVKLALSVADDNDESIPSGAIQLSVQAKASVTTHRGIAYDWAEVVPVKLSPEDVTEVELADGQRLVITRVGDV